MDRKWTRSVPITGPGQVNFCLVSVKVAELHLALDPGLWPQNSRGGGEAVL